MEKWGRDAKIPHTLAKTRFAISSRVLGTYLLGVEGYKKAREVLPYALGEKSQH